MDKEILDAITAQLLQVKIIIESVIDQLDVETFESLETGKTIALNFDDVDLTNVQISVDEGITLLQNLSEEINNIF